jgi:ferritin-like metal-binding protein YciE
MSKLANLRDLLVNELKDLYSAENQLVKALPAMVKGAECEKLSAGFKGHLEQTKGHVERLEKVMEILKESPKGQKCKAMEGLVVEAKEMLEKDAEPAVRDAALITSAQRVEHYEISGYGSVIAFAKLLGEDDVADILQSTLDEEEETDKKLTELAESGINEKAAELAEA